MSKMVELSIRFSSSPADTADIALHRIPDPYTRGHLDTCAISPVYLILYLCVVMQLFLSHRCCVWTSVCDMTVEGLYTQPVGELENPTDMI